MAAFVAFKTLKKFVEIGNRKRNFENPNVPKMLRKFGLGKTALFDKYLKIIENIR